MPTNKCEYNEGKKRTQNFYAYSIFVHSRKKCEGVNCYLVCMMKIGPCISLSACTIRAVKMLYKTVKIVKNISKKRNNSRYTHSDAYFEMHREHTEMRHDSRLFGFAISEKTSTQMWAHAVCVGSWDEMCYK